MPALLSGRTQTIKRRHQEGRRDSIFTAPAQAKKRIMAGRIEQSEAPPALASRPEGIPTRHGGFRDNGVCRRMQSVGVYMRMTMEKYNQ